MKMFSDTILENLKSIMVVLDKQGNLEYISSSVKNVLGYTPEQLMGGSWFDIANINEDEIKVFRSGVFKLIKNNDYKGVKYEQQIKTAYGRDKWILWSASKENEEKLIAIGQDITEIKDAETLLIKKNKELYNKNNETKQSIEYASRLQSAILPGKEYVKSCFENSFVYNQPKDIIGGDYYFIHKCNNKVILALVDCTGHGVPGALMSVVAHSLLKEVIINQKLSDPSAILYKLDSELFNVLNKNGEKWTNYDGMDVAIAIFDIESRRLTFSGAFRPLLIVRGDEVLELKPNRYPIGFYADVQKIFENKEISLIENDVLYMFTDGYSDQFGGENYKKFNKKRFKELLLFIQSMEMYEQESFLSYALNNWKQNEPQTDDILIIGIKI